jgi:type II secretory pathway component GspD/PulD (secretin)
MTLTPSRRLGARSLMVFALALLPLTLAAKAQDNQSPAPSPEPVNPCAAIRNSPTETRTFYLTNAIQQNDDNEIMVAIRNMLCPTTKIYLVANQKAIIIAAPPSQLAIADKLIHDLDRPAKTYRVTYTLTELDAGKTVSTAHYSMLLGDGEHSSLKEGNKIPIATGSYSDGNTTGNGVQTQFTYLDIGMSFDATIAASGNSVRLKSKVEDSSLDQPVTISGVTEPVVRQSVLDGTSLLTLDKPAMLGTIDVPNSTRHVDIAVVVEQIK